MKRIFIAIDISEAARKAAVEHIERLRASFGDLRVGWERPEKLHLTLKFLGDVGEGKLGELKESLGRIASAGHPFSVRLEGCGVFPPSGAARSLWIGFSDGGDLGTIARQIDAASAVLGYPGERRSFKPHLTIARIREPQRSRDLAAAHRRTQFPALEVAVREIVLFESKLQPSGSIYGRLARLPLGRVTLPPRRNREPTQ